MSERKLERVSDADLIGAVGFFRDPGVRYVAVWPVGDRGMVRTDPREIAEELAERYQAALRGMEAAEAAGGKR